VYKIIDFLQCSFSHFLLFTCCYSSNCYSTNKFFFENYVLIIDCCLRSINIVRLWYNLDSQSRMILVINLLASENVRTVYLHENLVWL